MGGGVQLVHSGTRDVKNIDVLKCDSCGTKFLSKFNNNDYENGFMYASTKKSQVPIEQKLKSCEPDDVRRFNDIKEIITGKDVLDFGCGFGGFMTRAKEVCRSISGVELGLEERNYITSKTGMECKKDISEYDKQFDIITLFHVFEHLDQPREWLQKFHASLKQGGLLIIEVPNANDVLLELYQNEKFADFTYWSAHLFLYNLKSLQSLINSTNLYEIVKTGYIQRYPLANHLYWLSKGLPGGQNVWKMFDSELLNAEYKKALETIDGCDTIFVVCRKR